MDKLGLFVPQWQGSGISKELYYGAYALKDFIKTEYKYAFRSIRIDTQSTPIVKNNILGYDIIAKQLREIQEILREQNPIKIFTIGGGCGIEVPIVSYIKDKHQDITLFWFDAHGDLNSPESSESKHFHGMPLRFLTDKVDSIGNIHINKVPVANTILIGTRDLDKPEIFYIKDNGIKLIPIETLRDKNHLEPIINKYTGKAYIHIDLDVLDPKHYSNVKCPAKQGLSIEELTSSIEIIKRQMEVVGLSIVENTELDSKEIMKLHNIIKIGVDL